MTYLYCIVLLGLVAFFAQSCIGGVEKKLVTQVSHNGHELRIYEFTQTVGLGAYSHGAHMFLDGKEISTWDPTWPIQPEIYPNWVVKTFSEAPDSWIVYVSPSKYSRSQFGQLVACYDANKAKVDADLKAQFTLYDTERFQIIGRFVYGDKPEPIVFKPTLSRYQPFTGYGFSEKAVIDREEIVVQPDGKWEFFLWQTEKGHSQGGSHLHGEIELQNGQLYFTPPADEGWVEFPVSVRADAASRLDYLRSFKDAQGRRLDAVFVWK